ncbi:L,D-transpeptidase [Ahrensia sp. R2A130]|uniref:L,D-transpeptidase n=1 Tax=Ahrensia sp. R2A130 TaxID=744979 RepID=UPI0001E0E0A3|nr:L,D-transpeptidase [Ahrensia sp. R2A130]EFL89327.1 ErfK/YbiS/YcfS/YnhG family protein [Ahrensia sp. R2A130]
MNSKKTTGLNRRKLLLAGAGAIALPLAGCVQRDPQVQARIQKRKAQNEAWAFYERLYGPVPDEQFPLPAINLRQVKPQFFRREVDNPTGQGPGTLVVDTKNFYLYWPQANGRAMRYGVGLGRAGFDWSGNGVIQWKQRWPKWTPPAEMIAREPDLEKWSAANGGMPPGLENPLGARALYIFQDGKDTLYRVHGSPEAFSIGKAVSSGCVRLLNQDIIDLYERVPSGSRILVI